MNGNVETVSYDDVARTMTINQPDGSVINATLDRQGRTKLMQFDDGAVIDYNRAPDGDMIDVLRPDGVLQAWPKDAAGRTTGMTLDGEAVQEINDHLQQVHRELRFNIDTDSGRTVIKVVDAETKEVIRQIPDEEALKFAQRLNEGIGFKLLNAYS